VGHDKKRSGNLVKLVLARAPGDVVIKRVGLAELRAAMLELG
jgi:3-dehydroquinate synthetase